MAKQKQKAERKVTIENHEIANFFAGPYYDYAIYVLEQRAIPSIIDGLKPGARKIINAAFKTLPNTKVETKFLDLVGSTMSISKYHHGDSSIEGTIVTLGQSYSDNTAPLELLGNGGTLKDNTSAAPRYLDVKLSKWSTLLKQNENILEYNYDNGVKVEPKHYLPLIPLILMSRTSGLAIGFKYSLSTSYNPYSITSACIEYLKTGELTQELIPHINEWSGSFIRKESEDKVFARGKYDLSEQSKGILNVYEFSPTETYSSFEDNLKALTESGKIVKWENLSYEDDIHYKIYLNKDALAKQIAGRKIEATYKISKWLDKSTLSVLDENSKLKEFTSIKDIVTYFVDYRLDKYIKLKEVIISDLKQQITETDIIRQFIDLYLSGKIVISKDVTIEETKLILDKFNIPHEVLDIPIRRLTKDEYDKLTDKIKNLNLELDEIMPKTAKDLYLSDLEKLQKEFKQDFPLADYTVVPDNEKVMN
jgi:DNA gyrase/topoisomerase IV subunit A